MTSRHRALSAAIALVLAAIGAVDACAQSAAAANAGSCRRRDPGQIVGGTQAAIRNWPGFAALRARDSNGDILYFCGGSLISPSIVLTAAHCVQRLEKDSEGRWMLPQRGVVEVLFETDDLRTAAAARVRAVSDRFVHEEWSGDVKQGNDIALLRLKEPWNGTRARLADTDLAEGASSAFVSGFGLLADRKDGDTTTRWENAEGLVTAGSRWLQEVMVPTVARTTCARAYPDLRSGQLCAGYDEGRKDSCHGDSGGPLNALDDAQCPYQIGIVSYGDSCARAKAYGIYTRVTPYLGWIRRHSQNFPIGDQRILPEAGGVTSGRALDEMIDRMGDRRGQVHIALGPSAQLRLGQRLTIEVTADSPGRLLLLDANSRGEIVQLYPNSHTPAQLIGPSAPIHLPGPDSDYSFKALPPTGPGRLVAILVPSHISLEREVSGSSLLARTLASEAEPTNYAMNLVRQMLTSMTAPAPQGSSAAQAESAWSVEEQRYTIEP